MRNRLVIAGLIGLSAVSLIGCENQSTPKQTVAPGAPLPASGGTVSKEGGGQVSTAPSLEVNSNYKDTTGSKAK